MIYRWLKIFIKIFLGIHILAIAFIIGALIFMAMPLPFRSSLWESHTARYRMVGSVSKKVIGLHRDEIVTLLGEPHPSQGNFTAPGRGMYYVLGHPRGYFRFGVKIDILVIFLDENSIAVDCAIRKG